MRLHRILISLSLCLAPALAVADDDRVRATDEYEKRIEDLTERERELVELARELEQNSFELLEIHETLAPEIQEKIREAIVIRSRPIIGVTIGPLDKADGKVRGVGVLSVTPDGPAAESGIQSGDLIVGSTIRRWQPIAVAKPSVGSSKRFRTPVPTVRYRLRSSVTEKP